MVRCRTRAQCSLGRLISSLQLEAEVECRAKLEAEVECRAKSVAVQLRRTLVPTPREHSGEGLMAQAVRFAHIKIKQRLPRVHGWLAGRIAPKPPRAEIGVRRSDNQERRDSKIDAVPRAAL